MGMIRNHLKQMKAEDPKGYKALMEGYKSETELIRDICGLSIRAINDYYLKGKRNHNKKFGG